MARVRCCQSTVPAAAYEAWVAAAGIIEGAVFRGVDRHGRVGGRLSGQAVALIVQRRAAAGLAAPLSYAAHSMRAGFATSAAQAGMGEIRNACPLHAAAELACSRDKGSRPMTGLAAWDSRLDSVIKRK